MLEKSSMNKEMVILWVFQTNIKGKGIYHYANGDKFCGDWKNDKSTKN